MEVSRTYGEACAAAHALDLVGERWALLIVRELLFGPKRFSDLRTGLPTISPNRLTERLRELAQHGVVRRRKLGPPSGAWAYELTEWGRELEPVLIQLGSWGRRSPFRDLDAHISTDALMLALRGDFHPPAGEGWHATCVLRFGADEVVVRVAGRELEVSRGQLDNPDLVMDTDPRTFVALMTRRQTPEQAIEAGGLTMSGDATVFDRLLTALPRPQTSVLVAN